MYEKGIEYYNKGEYSRSLALMDRVKSFSTYSIGSKRAQTIAYYRAYSTYGKGFNEAAAELFKQFIAAYPESPYYEECLYMVGYCYYKCSPRALLDQKMSKQAIEYLGLFKSRFPASEKIPDVEKYIAELFDKISYKAFLSASNYYDREKYKSAVTMLTNSIKEYPQSSYREEMMNMLFCSKFYLAENSVDDKRLERAYAAQEEYFYFKEEFPESRFLDDMATKMKKIDGYIKNYKFED